MNEIARRIVKSIPTKTNKRFKFNYTPRQTTEFQPKNLQRSKAAGLDILPPGFYSARGISSSLCYIINRSIYTGVFPPTWKIAKVTPVYKSGSANKIENYSPVSILSVVSKVMEKEVHKQFSVYLEENKLISNFQFGFRRNKSTELAAITLVQEIRQSVDSGLIAGVCFLARRLIQLAMLNLCQSSRTTVLMELN